MSNSDLLLSGGSNSSEDSTLFFSTEDSLSASASASGHGSFSSFSNSKGGNRPIYKKHRSIGKSRVLGMGGNEENEEKRRARNNKEKLMGSGERKVLELHKQKDRKFLEFSHS